MHTDAIAVPVVGPRGAVVAALELSSSAGSNLRLAHPALLTAARCLTRELIAGAAELASDRHTFLPAAATKGRPAKT